MQLKDIIKPTLMKALAAFAIALAFPLLDRIFSYCTEDMCFNGIYRLAGSDMYRYFFLANVMKWVIIILLAYALLSAIYLIPAYFIRKRKR
jgi:hypothetical protein